MPRCAECVIAESEECDFCAHWYHADKPCKETDVLLCGLCHEMSHCCCEGMAAIEICDGETLHRLCHWHLKEICDERRAREAGVD